jgi:hypothetical protein
MIKFLLLTSLLMSCVNKLMLTGVDNFLPVLETPSSQSINEGETSFSLDFPRF